MDIIRQIQINSIRSVLKSEVVIEYSIQNVTIYNPYSYSSKFYSIHYKLRDLKLVKEAEENDYRKQIEKMINEAKSLVPKTNGINYCSNTITISIKSFDEYINKLSAFIYSNLVRYKTQIKNKAISKNRALLKSSIKK